MMLLPKNWNPSKAVVYGWRYEPMTPTSSPRKPPPPASAIRAAEARSAVRVDDA